MKRRRKTTRPSKTKKKKKPRSDGFPSQAVVTEATAVGDTLMKCELLASNSPIAIRWSWESPELLGLKMLQRNPPGLSPRNSLDVIRSCYACNALLETDSSCSIWYGPKNAPALLAIVFHCKGCKPPHIPEESRLVVGWTRPDATAQKKKEKDPA